MSMMIFPGLFGEPVVPTISASSQTIQNTSGTSVTTSSNSPVAGELLILFLAYGENLADATSIVWPSGFTEGGRLSPFRASGAWAWKIATGSETSTYTVSWSTGNTRSILSLIRIANHNGIEGYSTDNRASNSNAPRAPAYSSTPTPSKRLVLHAFGWGGGTGTITPPTLTPAVSVLLSTVFTSAGSNTDGTGCAVLAREETTTTYASWTSTSTWTGNASGSYWASFSIAIKYGVP